MFFFVAQMAYAITNHKHLLNGMILQSHKFSMNPMGRTRTVYLPTFAVKIPIPWMMDAIIDLHGTDIFIPFYS